MAGLLPATTMTAPALARDAALGGLPLSRAQVRSIAHATARMNVWEGAVRSGKTIASLLAWLLYVADAPRGGVLVVAGKTLDTIARNVFGPLSDPALFGEFAQHVKYTRGASTAVILGRQIEIIPANDAKAEAKLRGLTAAGAYVDEATLVPEAYWTQLLARLSVAGARLFATTNPDGPGHWLRKKFLLRKGELDLRSWRFTLDDNPSLDPQYVRSLKAEYVGLWYRRFILGEWCLAEGAVFDMWDEDRHVVDELPAMDRWLAVGIDYGTVNPFAALLLGVGSPEPDPSRPAGVTRRLYLVDEWRYDSRTALRQLTDSEYAGNVHRWLREIERPGEQGANRGVSPEWWVVDPSAASFKTQLWRGDRQAGAPPVSTVTDADNAVVDGIRLVATLLARDLLRVHRRCEGWREEIPGYSWDDEKALKGEDAPIKADDHSLDAGRYAVKTTEWAWRPYIGREAA